MRMHLLGGLASHHNLLQLPAKGQMPTMSQTSVAAGLAFDKALACMHVVCMCSCNLQMLTKRNRSQLQTI